MPALAKLPSAELGWRSRVRWQWPLMAIAVALLLGLPLLGLPERALAQAYRAAPETMQIEDQPGYIPDPEAERLPAMYQRQVVFYRTTEAPGTIIVQTSERYLYVVQPNSRAIRYGIGVGRDGFQWSGMLKIVRKAEWRDLAGDIMTPEKWEDGSLQGFEVRIPLGNGSCLSLRLDRTARKCSVKPCS